MIYMFVKLNFIFFSQQKLIPKTNFLNGCIFNIINQDFSLEIKSLQPHLRKTTCDIRRIQLQEEFFSEFRPIARAVSEEFDFCRSDITNDEMKHFLKVLVEDKNVFSNFTFVFAKIAQDF